LSNYVQYCLIVHTVRVYNCLLGAIFRCCSDGGTSGKKKLMTVDQFVDFLNRTQRDPRLNEILHPYANSDRATDLIREFEPNKQNSQRGLLSFDGFLKYLMSADNPIVSSTTFELNNDMDQPLSHYFINSSHNTYLTGNDYARYYLYLPIVFCLKLIFN